MCFKHSAFISKTDHKLPQQVNVIHVKSVESVFFRGFHSNTEGLHATPDKLEVVVKATAP